MKLRSTFAIAAAFAPTIDRDSPVSHYDFRRSGGSLSSKLTRDAATEATGLVAVLRLDRL